MINREGDAWGIVLGGSAQGKCHGEKAKGKVLDPLVHMKAITQNLFWGGERCS